MARQIASGRELSFHKGVKQWYRTVPKLLNAAGEQVRGRKYFGTGRGVSDRVSYKLALGKYHAYLNDWELQRAYRTLYRQLSKGQEVEAPIGRWLKKHRPALMDATLSDEQAIECEDQHQSLRLLQGASHATPSKPPEGQSISDHMDRWLAGEYRRYEAGEITEVAYKSKAKGIKTFREMVKGQGFENPMQVERLLGEYRALLLGMLASHVYTGHTVNDKGKFLRQFIQWCYKNRVLEEMPRCLEDVVKRVAVNKGGKPLTVDQIQKLWQAAGARMRCFIALGLNCGFKNSDIAGMHTNDLEDGRLIGYRGKTGVPMNYKLWPVTQQLIALCRQDKGGKSDERLFTTTHGEAIPSGTLSALFKKVATRAKVEVGTNSKGQTRYATFEQLRDTSAELVKQSLMEQGIDMGVLQVFLAHKDQSTAIYYVSNDPKAMKTTKLDHETETLQKTFGLMHDES